MSMGRHASLTVLISNPPNSITTASASPNAPSNTTVITAKENASLCPNALKVTTATTPIEPVSPRPLATTTPLEDSSIRSSVFLTAFHSSMLISLIILKGNAWRIALRNTLGIKDRESV